MIMRDTEQWRRGLLPAEPRAAPSCPPDVAALIDSMKPMPYRIGTVVREDDRMVLQINPYCPPPCPS